MKFRRVFDHTDELRHEAQELLERLEGSEGYLDDRSIDFIDGLRAHFERWGDRTHVSRKQVFWLRDLVEKAEERDSTRFSDEDSIR